MIYNILIKSNSYNNKDLYKFYQENGDIYETDSLEKLTSMYNKLLKDYTIKDIIPIHKLDVNLNTEITGCETKEETNNNSNPEIDDEL